MIDFNFEPQAIDLIKSIDVIKEHGESISQVSLPSHEDIGSEIQSEEKNIQSLGKEILSANEDILSDIKSMFSNDFDSKFYLYVQLLSKNITSMFHKEIMSKVILIIKY